MRTKNLGKHRLGGNTAMRLLSPSRSTFGTTVKAYLVDVDSGEEIEVASIAGKTTGEKLNFNLAFTNASLQKKVYRVRASNGSFDSIPNSRYDRAILELV